MQDRRRSLTTNEQALLEVAALQPISHIPKMHLPVAEKLAQQGFLEQQGDHWYPTPDGLAVTSRAAY